MKHKKSPQLLWAGCLGGCKNGYKIITNSSAKNNAPNYKINAISYGKV